MRRLGRHLVATYLQFDPRSLGLFRVLLGIVLLIDLYLRYVDVDAWYTDAGIVPSHLVRHANPSRIFSPFFYAWSHSQAVWGMVACAVVYILLAIGFKTRVCQLLSLIAVVSLNNRLFLLENGGNSVLNLLCAWSLFLPLGRRFSIDALLARRRARPDGPGSDDRPVTSLAVLALLLQFGTLYLFNFLQKTGPAWHDGSAVYYVLHDERMNTALAVWMREHLPYSMLQAMTWSTLTFEAAAVVLILSPLWTRQLRLAAILLLPALHLGFGLCLTLGIFSPAMMSFFALLVAREDWEWLGRLRGLQPRRPAPDPGPSPGWAGLRRGVAGLREATVLLVMVASVGDLAASNPAWPQRLRYTQPALLDAIVWYPRIRQYWRMFSPEPPRSVSLLSVEAQTVDGRTVDPYNQVASRYPAIPGPDEWDRLPVRLGQDQLFSDYTARMPQPGFEWTRVAFGGWILRYDNRTGNAADKIVRFHVYQVTAAIREPGSAGQSRPIRRRLFGYPD